MHRYKPVLYDVLLFLVAIFFVTIFSYTTSPLYTTLGDTPDSPIFQIIGKYWVQGYVPYQDLWDLKGPYIFLVNAVGYGITSDRYGVWMLQILFLFVTLVITYKTFLRYFNERNAFGLTVLSLAILSYTYQGGNLTEEYLLPFLALAFYFIINWIHHYEYEVSIAHYTHHPSHACLYGMVLGLSLMSRLTNALPICGALLVISFVLLRHKAYKNFCKNVLSFIIGLALTTIPFLVYFYSKNALPEMWKGTFLYAARYAANTSYDLMEIGIHYFILSYFNSILLLSLSILILLRKKKATTSAILWFLTAALPFLWFCQSNGYGHYGTIAYPLFTVSMIIISREHLTFLRFVVITFLLIGCASKVRFMYTMYTDWQDDHLIRYKTFLKQHPMIDYSSFVIYNGHPHIYLDMGIRPSNPIFSIQDMGIERIPEWHTNIINSYQTHKTKWIVVDVEDYPVPAIQKILDDDYALIMYDKKNNLKLYNLHKE